MDQDNDSFETRISNAVAYAVFEAARVPGTDNMDLDVSAALRGMCRGMACIAATVGQMPDDRETGAKMIESMGAEIVAQLAFCADLIRSGGMSARPVERPKPRLVE